MGPAGPRLECPEGTVLLSLHRGGSTAYLPCFDYSWSLLCLWERLGGDDKPLGNAAIKTRLETTFGVQSQHDGHPWAPGAC